jgi:hypothetical protein
MPVPSARSSEPSPLVATAQRASALGRATVDAVDPRPCTVLEPPDRWPGRVLAWQRSESGWRGLVEFRRMTPEGWPLTYLRWLSVDVLEPR